MKRSPRPSISNGQPAEQAAIRNWWHEQHAGKGRIVWEFYLDPGYADAIWFPDDDCQGVEEPGKDTRRLFLIKGREIYILEAKRLLGPELIGQALVYRKLAEGLGARILGAVVFAGAAHSKLIVTAEQLGLRVVVAPALQPPE